MKRNEAAIAVAELRVAQSRRDLDLGLHRLRARLSRPSTLAAAVVAGMLAGILLGLTRRVRTGAVAGTLAAALIRYGMKRLTSS